MKFLARILAPVDFSERCAGAARYGAALAQRFQAELILLHVLPPAPPEVSEEAYQRNAAETERRLSTFPGAGLDGVPARRIVIKGDPARKIVQYAQDEDADMILMPTHGFGPVRPFILGSNTAKVLHDADCPVCTGLHTDDEGFLATIPPRHILCAVDLGPASRKALDWAMALQKPFDARLTIVHATPAVPALTKGSEANWNMVVRDAAEKELERLRQEAGARAATLIEAGDPAQVISAAAHRLTADALVIARGSASGVFGRLRTNAYAIIGRSPCPVVSV
jgi:nucleotide-binding universal stress UspA family protein